MVELTTIQLLLLWTRLGVFGCFMATIEMEFLFIGSMVLRCEGRGLPQAHCNVVIRLSIRGILDVPESEKNVA